MRRRQILTLNRPAPVTSIKTTLVVDFDRMSDELLARAFEAEFGAKPHHRMKRQTIVERLNDACNIST